ncbi:MAG TPA: hypothetical protein PLS90_08210 [Candidatus Sumerlaeota bacterium]|nr:hypothetical protein [Candidatus Sumerlaeota bacterium]
MLRLDPKSKTLNLRHPAVKLENWQLGITANGNRLKSTQADVELLDADLPHFRLKFPDLGLVWMVRGETDEEHGTLLLHSQLTNESNEPIALGKVYPLECPGRVQIGQTDQNVVNLPLPVGQFGRKVGRITDLTTARASKIKFQFYNQDARLAFQVGFITFQRANTEIHYNFDEQNGMRGLRAFCDFDGWKLQPGQSTSAETFILAVGDNPFRQLEHWADLAAAAAPCPPRVWEDAPIGWVGFSWVDPFTVERYEDVVLRNAEAIEHRLKGFGADYIWVSIGNMEAGIAGDWLSWNERAFPSGCAYLVHRLRQYGLKLGFWVGPFWVGSNLKEILEELGEDALQHKPDGSRNIVCKKYAWGRPGFWPREERPDMYGLDPTHPRAHKFIRETFETYRRWGIRYYMLDFLSGGTGNMGGYDEDSPEVDSGAPASHPDADYLLYAKHHDPTVVSGPEAYCKFLKVVRDAAGDDTYFLASTGPTVHNVGLMDGVRTGNDFGGGMMLYPETDFLHYPGTYVIGDAHFWTGPLPALMSMATSYYTHRRLYLNDVNMLTIDKPVPITAARMYATIHGISGGPTMIGDDLDRMDEDRLAMIKKTLPRSPEIAVPVDLFDRVAPDYPRIFQRKIKKPWGEFDVVSVFNFSSEPLVETVELSRLGLDPDAEYVTWEFWNEEYVGLVRGALRACVAPGSVSIYRLARNNGYPMLLATDMHMMMGEMEIDASHWDAAAGTLAGRALRPCGERGNLYLWAPNGLEADDPTGLWLAKDNRDHSLVVKLPMVFGPEGSRDWSVRFIPLRKELPPERCQLI